VTATFRFWRVPAAVWAGLIFVSGMVPSRGVVRAVSDGHDALTTSLAHFVVYAVLGFLLGQALCGWPTDFRRLVFALALAAALGGAIELIQGPLPYRDAQLADFIVDVAGAAAGLAVFSVAAAVARSRSRRG
jgi:VanZ family protein